MDDQGDHHGDEHGKRARLPAEPRDDASESITERVSKSASALARDALFRPSAGGATRALASFAASTQKGQSSSSSVGSAMSFSTLESSSSRPSTADSSSKPIFYEATEERFRSDPRPHEDHTWDPASLNFDAFLSGQDSSSFDAPPIAAQKEKQRSPTPYRPTKHDQGSHGSFEEWQQGFRDHGRVPWNEESHQTSGGRSIGHGNRVTVSSLSDGPFPRAVALEARNFGPAQDALGNISHHDGAAVVALLSEPGFTADDEPADYPGLAGNQTKLEHLDLQSTRCKKSAQPRLGLADHEFGLIPNFALSNYDPSAVADAMPRAEGQTCIADLKPWLDILDSYQDEVWGDFLPLVQQARKELETADAEDGIVDDKPAVRRLQMLLGHFDPRTNSRFQ